MTMAIISQSILGVSLTLLFVSSTAHAEAFRWADGSGRTHHSEQKEGAGKAKAVELKGMPRQATNSSTLSSPEEEKRLKQRQMRKPQTKPRGPSSATRPKSPSGGRDDGTDASRCALARDILSGAVRHRNGKPTDDYDRQVAENDVRSFCH
jgi:hypothetical protein